MRRWLVAALAVVGCSTGRSFVRVDDVALGRVVVYRNGVAYYERQATVAPGQRELRMVVPADKVDDFLKSLTILDRDSGKPLPVSFPHRERTGGGTVEMTIGLPDQRSTRLLLTYITEAPAWKPSYRIEVKDGGTVLLQGWAIVDNTSAEDWKNVLLGVGTSSAMSFRYDLWSIRSVDRRTLSPEERFAEAPPLGGSPYRREAQQKVVLATLADDGATGRNIPAPGRSFESVLRGRDAGGIQGRVTDETSGVPLLLVTVTATSGSGSWSEYTDDDGRYWIDVPPGSYTVELAYGDAKTRREHVEVARGRATTLMATMNTRSTGEQIVIREKAPLIDPGTTKQGMTIDLGRKPPPPSPSAPAAPAAAAQADPGPRLDMLAESVRRSARVVIVEGFAAAGEAEPAAASSRRANDLRNALIGKGVSPAQLRAEGRGLVAGQPAGARLVVSDEELAGEPVAGGDGSDAPVGESDFRSGGAVTVPRSSSVMMSTIRTDTEGEIVYLYDPDSARGDRRFAFRAVRFKNPTPSTLDTGPLTVYGQGRFIGEGLAEPISAHAAAVVPFALDRQIVVDREDSDEDRIASLLALSRGNLTASVRHVKRLRLAVTNRLDRPATVYVRHAVPRGWELLRGPEGGDERLGDAHLFKVELAAGASRTVEVEEATPLEKTIDLRTPAGLELVRVYATSTDADPKLAERLKDLLARHRDLANAEERRAGVRDRLGDLRERLDELHLQVVSLHGTRGKLMDHLQARLRDVSDRVHAAVLEEIDAREKLALARTRFQDGVAELSLE